MSNTFKWQIAGTFAWSESGIAITTSPHNLAYGISVTFNSATGHRNGQAWSASTVVDAMLLLKLSSVAFGAAASMLSVFGNFHDDQQHEIVVEALSATSLKWKQDGGQWSAPLVTTTASPIVVSNGLGILISSGSAFSASQMWVFSSLPAKFYTFNDAAQLCQRPSRPQCLSTGVRYLPVDDICSNLGAPSNVVFTSSTGLNNIEVLYSATLDTNSPQEYSIDITTATFMPVFEGVGLNDLIISGASALLEDDLVITIDGPGTFKWAIGDGSGYTTSQQQQSISSYSNATALHSGLSIRFVHTNGHTEGDRWTVSHTDFFTWQLNDAARSVPIGMEPPVVVTLGTETISESGTAAFAVMVLTRRVGAVAKPATQALIIAMCCS